MGELNFKVSTGLLSIKFADENGDVLSSFKMNPTDVNIAKRCAEVADYFKGWEDKPISTIDDAAEINRELEEKICYILGYDAKESVFGEVTATTVLEDGRMFGMAVMEAIANAVNEESRKRAKKSDEAVKKYTAKYDSV